MLSEIFKQKAISDQKHQQRLLSWKHSPYLTSFLGYLYWRNRFALLTKITSRFLIILEIYLINHYFNFFIATSFGLILFVFYYLKEFQRGIVQASKLEVIQTKAVRNDYNANLALGSLLTIDLLYGFIVPIILFFCSFYLKANSAVQIFLACWILIFPFQLISSSLWSVLYGFRRLRRSFSLIIFFRLFPIIFLCFLGEEFGIISYLFGFLLGRSLEFIYLSQIAAQALLKIKISPTFKFSKIKNFYSKYLPQVIFPLSFAMYNCLLAIMIFLRERSEWLSYFFIIYFLNICIYFILRGPQSLLMDFYLSLSGLHLSQAKAWFQKIIKTRNVVLILIVLLLIGFFFYNPAFYWGLPQLVKFTPFILLLLLARSFFQTKSLVIQSGFLENKFVAKVSLVFVALIVLQALLLFVWRANLSLVFLVEGVSLIILSLSLTPQKYLAKSVLYQFKKDLIWDRYHFSVTDTLSERKIINLKNSLLIQIDAEFEAIRKRDIFLKELINFIPENSKLIPVCSGTYLIVLDNSFTLSEIKNNLKLKFATIIRNVLVIDHSQTIINNLKFITETYQKTSAHSRQANRGLAFTRYLISNSEQFNLILKFASKLRNEELSLDRKYLLIKDFLEQNSFLQLKFFGAIAELSKARVTVSHRLFHQRQESRSALSQFLVSISKKPFVEISYLGKLLFTIDYSELDPKMVERFLATCWGINLGLLIGHVQES